MKWIALAALLAAPMAQAQPANDGMWLASNLVEGCDATVKMLDGRLAVPEAGTDEEMQAATVTMACASYVRGFAEAMFMAGRVEAGGHCIAVPREAMVQEIVSQAIATAQSKPYLVAPGAPSANLIWAALERLHPCE